MSAPSATRPIIVEDVMTAPPATHDYASGVDFLNINDSDLVLQSAVVEVLDPCAKTLVATVRAAGPSGSSRIELDLRVRDRNQSIRITPVERFGEPTS
jgi:hypothetical protein